MDSKVYSAVSNLGTRPTVDGSSLRLETHIFADFTEPFYGKLIRTELCSFLRDEKKFSSTDELSKQIEQDCALARKFHGL